MADIKTIADQLVELSVKEVNELAQILKDEHGIEPAAAAAPVMMAGGGDAGGYGAGVGGSRCGGAAGGGGGGAVVGRRWRWRWCPGGGTAGWWRSLCKPWR